VLNDVFGIQARGGCSCAGPYGHRLLSIDQERSYAFQHEIGLGCDGIKPGWVRLNFNYFITDAVRDFLIEAVHLIARYGRRLAGDYDFDAVSGMWRHRRRMPLEEGLAQMLTSAAPPAAAARPLTEEVLTAALHAARDSLGIAETSIRRSPTPVG
jgi:hypothetical protein